MRHLSTYEDISVDMISLDCGGCLSMVVQSVAQELMVHPLMEFTLE